ncbi:MAG: hypothetical protein MI923_13565 [Phycisphaerales bacterium]|nr:hypothetical protein [Phycisphaerales bacterium]
MKRLFLAISLMAIFNLAALAGLVLYASNQGWLERERVHEALAVLKGEMEEETTVVQQEEEQPEPTNSVDERIRRNKELEEKQRIELERREREVKNLWALLETRELEFLRAREDFEADKQRFKDQREQRDRQEGNSGLQAELETLSGVDAKTAKELLRLRDDADVARILMAMDGRKRNKIVKQCKTSEERLWIGRIMEKFHDSKTAQAEDLGAG